MSTSLAGVTSRSPLRLFRMASLALSSTARAYALSLNLPLDAQGAVLVVSDDKPRHDAVNTLAIFELRHRLSLVNHTPGV